MASLKPDFVFTLNDAFTFDFSLFEAIDSNTTLHENIKLIYP